MKRCPAAWEELMAFLYPVVIADTFGYEPEDHIDDGVPTRAEEWDLFME